MTKSQLKENYLRNFGNYTDRAYYVDKMYSHFNAFDNMVANEDYIAKHYDEEKLYITMHYIGVWNKDMAKDLLTLSQELNNYLIDAIADYTYNRLIDDGLDFVKNKLAKVVTNRYKEKYGNIIDAFTIEVEPHSYYENRIFYISYTVKEDIDKLLDMIDLSKIQTAQDIYFIVRDVIQNTQKLFNVYSGLVETYIDKTNTNIDVKEIIADYIEDRDIILNDVIEDLADLMMREKDTEKQDKIGWILGNVEEIYRKNIQTDMQNKYNDEVVEEITIDIPFYYEDVVIPDIKDKDPDIVREATHDIYFSKILRSAIRYYSNIIDEYLDEEETKLSFYYTYLYEIRLIDYKIDTVDFDNENSTLSITYRCSIPVEKFTDEMIDSGYTFKQIAENIEERLYQLTEDFKHYVSNKQFCGDFSVSEKEILDYIQ